MSEEERLRSENLVEIHRARDEWEGNLLIGYLRDNGIEATLEGKMKGPESAVHAGFADPDRSCGIFVLEDEAKRAAELVTEFLSAATDDNILQQTAAQKLQVDRETIARLRDAVREERRTFELLGWIGVVFLGAAALLWAIWPAWLKVASPPPEFRWVVVILLVLAAVFAGGRASKRK
ncbi:MAG: hypothetical protein ABSH21_02995 [Verrucomicrobiia bacterium]|jgi:hypothetical protein